MDSVAAAIRSASMPKFLQFHTVISSVIPSLGESRIMQVPASAPSVGRLLSRTAQLYDIASLLHDAWHDRSFEECFAEAARYCGIVHAFLLQAAHSDTKPAA